MENINTLPKRKGDQDKLEYCIEHYGKGYKYIDRIVDRTKGLKTCAGKCGKTLPNTLQYFHKNSQAKDGLHYRCKECRNNAKKEYYQKKLKKIK